MTALDARADASASPRTVAGSDAGLLALTLHISADQANWRRVVFEGESPDYIDEQAAAWLAERPYLTVELDEDSTCYGRFPKTFDAVFASFTRDQSVVQAIVL